jgi:hypothetical protein
VNYNSEITKLRKQTDQLDNEIFEKIIELIKVSKHLKQKIWTDFDYVSLIGSDIEKRALQYKLDAHAVENVFKKILGLIENKEATAY